MKKVNFNFSKSLSRRSFLRGTGAAIALPWLESMTPAFAASVASLPPRRFVGVTLSLGLHAPNLVPTQSGRNYAPSPYLSGIADLLGDLTVVSGSSHPGVSGGHKAEGSILTAAPYSSNAVFKNSISIDQQLAKELGHHTRIPSLVLNVSGGNSPSYTENGSMIPAERSPSKLFRKLFIPDSPAEQARQIARLKQGKSIMDIVSADAKRLQNDLGAGDREKLDQYFTSVRNFEKRLVKSQDWAGKPKPQVNARQPVDITDNNAVVERKELMMAVMLLALQNDSTRFMTLHLNGDAGAIPIEGVNDGYHSLSHHGLDDEKIKQLALVETQLVKAWGKFVRSLKVLKEGNDSSLLDHTNVLLTSCLGNASAHNNKNLPVLLAGGGFKHGQHLAFSQDNNYPLANLYMSILQRHGLEPQSFGSSQSTMTGLEMA